jgi:hypothetical protein
MYSNTDLSCQEESDVYGKKNENATLESAKIENRRRDEPEFSSNIAQLSSVNPQPGHCHPELAVLSGGRTISAVRMGMHSPAVKRNWEDASSAKNGVLSMTWHQA